MAAVPQGDPPGFGTGDHGWRQNRYGSGSRRHGRGRNIARRRRRGSVDPPLPGTLSERQSLCRRPFADHLWSGSAGRGQADRAAGVEMEVRA